MVNRLRSINDLFDDFSNYIDDPLGYIGYGHVCFLQKDAPKSAYESSKCLKGFNGYPWTKF